MTVVTRFHRKSRLATLIKAPGGISAGVAVRRAAANLAPMRSEALAIVAGLVGELEALTPPRTPDETLDQLGEAYRLGLAVLHALGPFDLPHLHRAAWGLCELADRYDPGVGFDWRLVPVHARAMRLFLAGAEGGDVSAFDQVIAELDRAVAVQRPD